MASEAVHFLYRKRPRMEVGNLGERSETLPEAPHHPLGTNGIRVFFKPPQFENTLSSIVRCETMMKNSTAFRQSRQAVWVTGLIALVLWGAYTWLRWWPLAALASFMTLFLLGDAWNVMFNKRKLKADPEYLKKKVSGT